MEPESIELAWAAGFFDGDGCISVVRARRHRDRVYLRLATTHEGAIVRFADVVQAGTIRRVRLSSAYQRVPSFLWCVANNVTAALVLARLRPFLVAKAAHVRALEGFIEAPAGADLATAARTISTLNHRRYPGSRESLPASHKAQYRDDLRAAARQSKLRSA